VVESGALARASADVEGSGPGLPGAWNIQGEVAVEGALGALLAVSPPGISSPWNASAARWGRAKLPKLGWVTFRSSCPLGDGIQSATVSHKGGDWFVSFLVNDQARTPEQHAMPGTAVGVDRGVKVAAVTCRRRVLRGAVHHRRRSRPLLPIQRTNSTKARYVRFRAEEAHLRGIERSGIAIGCSSREGCLLRPHV
jgi:hypothetical protein